MNRTMRFVLRFAAASIGLLPTASFADDVNIASSTFDTDADGWSFVGNGTGVAWQPGGGNPGGHITVHSPGSGAVVYWSAPQKFLGNQAAALGGYLLFDLSASALIQPRLAEHVRLRGGGLVLSTYAEPLLPSVFPQWSSYRCVHLDASSPWSLATGGVATEAQIASVLASLDAIEIVADFNLSLAGSETAHLDNVFLVAGQAITTLHAFDGSAQGWTAVGDPVNPHWESTNGNPGGHVSVQDGRQGDYIYWWAPASLVEAMRYGFGGRLTFDLSQSNNPDGDAGPADVILLGNSGTLSFFDTKEPAKYPAWTHHNLHLDECQSWRFNSGPIATAAQIRSVLDGLQFVMIKAEFFTGGDEVDRIDNVGFAAPCSRLSWAGTDDAYQGSAESASPSPHLSAALALPALNFDEIPGVGTTSTNRQLAHTFTGLPAVIDAAVLLLDLSAGNGDAGPADETDDRIRLGFADAGGFLERWSAYIGEGNPEPGLVSGSWTNGRESVLGLDLSQLKLVSGDRLDLVPEIEAHGFLDVIVEDDTGADYLRLSYADCSPHLVDAEPGPAAEAAIGLTVGPNPIVGSARFRLAAARDVRARLAIFDLVGRRIVTLFDGPARGSWDVLWDGLDAGGSRAPAGLYFAFLEVGGERAMRRVVVVH